MYTETKELISSLVDEEIEVQKSSSHSDRVAYIKWIEVDSSIRNNGVGTKIRKDMIRDINGNSRQTIYTDIIDERLISVAKKQGFERITDGSSIDGWFVREGSKTVRFSSKD